MNYGIILNTLGWVLNIEAGCMLLPLICGVCYGEWPVVRVFAICIAICLVTGLGLIAIRPKNKTMYSHEGFTTVALSWIIMSLFGALPFVLSGAIPNYIDALFETVSGFTTTGASILSSVELMPKALLFWRSFTHWIGGMGVLVFLVAILPLSGGSNLFLLKAESPGPSVSKLVPKVKSTAKILYLIYLAMTLIQIILLLIGDMPLFDALTITFGTAGTGGFGIKDSSIADYSPYIQNVVTVFMILFGIDFTLYYLILTRRAREAFKSEEYKAYLGIITIATAIILFNTLGRFTGFFEALRHSAFQTASFITTTGYSTADFNAWPSLSKTVLVLLMFVGACAGSTGGGIKVSRILILLKSIRKEIRLVAHPRITHRITMNKRPLEHETVRSVNVYMAVYLTVFALSLLAISFDGFDFETNFTTVTTAMNNIGPAFSQITDVSSFGFFSPFSKLVLIFDMLIGRLEMFPMLILFSPFNWKK